MVISETRESAERRTLMKKFVNVFAICLTVVFVVALVGVRWLIEQPADYSRSGEFYTSIDYFNGEITEVSDEYLVMKPTEEWKWKETTRVVIPATQVRGDSEPQKIQTPLYEGTWSDLKPGDKIRVGFNAKSMEWTDDVVRISVVFMLYRVTDDESKE
jgi:hypothetical protein